MSIAGTEKFWSYCFELNKWVHGMIFSFFLHSGRFAIHEPEERGESSGGMFVRLIQTV
jgi:hypothetical protein